MCLPNACGAFYKPGGTAKDLTCPCGYRYWDIFQERFVPNPSARQFTEDGRALPREAHERDIKDKKSLSEFESSMRIQFFAHCISCGMRRRLDNKEKGDVGFDEQSLLRATAEVLEVAKGDFESRGGSMTMEIVQTSPAARNPVGSSLRSATSAAVLAPQTSLRRSEQYSSTTSRVPATRNMPEEALLPELPSDVAQRSRYLTSSLVTNTPAPKPGEVTIEQSLPQRHSERAATHPLRQDVYGTSPRHSTDPVQRSRGEGRDKGQMPAESRFSDRSRNSESPGRRTVKQIQGRLSPKYIGGGDEDEDHDSDESLIMQNTRGTIGGEQGDNKPPQPMFLPQEGTSQKVLEYHQERETFGKWTSIKSVRRNGKDGFLIGLAEGTRPLDSKQTQRILRESATYFDAAKKQLRNR